MSDSSNYQYKTRKRARFAESSPKRTDARDEERGPNELQRLYGSNLPPSLRWGAVGRTRSTPDGQAGLRPTQGSSSVSRKRLPTISIGEDEFLRGDYRSKILDRSKSEGTELRDRKDPENRTSSYEKRHRSKSDGRHKSSVGKKLGDDLDEGFEFERELRQLAAKRKQDRAKIEKVVDILEAERKSKQSSGHEKKVAAGRAFLDSIGRKRARERSYEVGDGLAAVPVPESGQVPDPHQPPDVDLSGSDDERHDEEAEKLKQQQRLEEYRQKEESKTKSAAKPAITLDAQQRLQLQEQEKRLEAGIEREEQEISLGAGVVQDEKNDEEKFRKEMAKRLANSGLSLDDNDRPVTGRELPTYFKIHRDHVSLDTLRDYSIPFQYDEVCVSTQLARSHTYLLQGLTTVYVPG